MTNETLTQSAADAAADRLRNAIRNGQYSAGQRLVEGDLTTELNISRGPLREAFRRLAAEGLIELRHNRGASVRLLSREELQSLYQIRAVLEGLAVRLTTQRIAGTSLLSDLDDLVKRMDRALDEGDLGHYIEINRSFHEFMLANCGSEQLRTMAEQLQVTAFRRQYRMMLNIRQLRVSSADHHSIREAIRSGDGGRAEQAMRDHITRSGLDALEFEAGNRPLP